MRFILRCRVRLLDLIKSNGDKKNTDETAQLGKQSADQIKRGKVWAALVRLYQLKVAVGSRLTLGTSTKIYLHSVHCTYPHQLSVDTTTSGPSLECDLYD